MTKVSSQKLLAMIQVQPGAVVSKTLLKKKQGTVTLFAFDAGQGLSEHTAPFEALVYLLTGELALTIGGEEHKLNSGEMIVLPPQVPHALEAITAVKFLLIMIRDASQPE
ncbi:MAG: cupin domain-containing protein [Fidelibacterota bacterium]